MGFLAFQWDAITNYAAGFFDSTWQPQYQVTVIAGTWMTAYKISSSSKAHAGGL